MYLEQYTSALAGFEEIITQNPYSYEGLVASWDYAATVLQMGTSNISGGFKDDVFFSFESSAYKDSLRMQKMLNTDNYDTKSFTKENRKAIFTNARDVFANEKKKQNEIVKSLEEKSKGGDLKASAELVKMITIKEVVKTNRPKTATEYLGAFSSRTPHTLLSVSSQSNYI